MQNGDRPTSDAIRSLTSDHRSLLRSLAPSLNPQHSTRSSHQTSDIKYPQVNQGSFF